MRLVKKIIIWVIAVFFSAMVVFSVAYNVFQSKIQSKIVSSINESIQGTISIDGLSFSLFSSYPKAIIDIDTMYLFEKKIVTKEDKPILSLKNIHLQLDVGTLWNKAYILDDVSLGSGDITIVSYADSTLNLLNAIETSNATDTTSDQANFLQLELHKLSIRDIKLTYNDRLTNQILYSKLQHFNAHLTLDGDSLLAGIELAYKLDSLVREGKMVFGEHHLNLASNLRANLAKLQVAISNGTIKLDLLEAHVNGVYNDVDSGFVDFTIWAKHRDLSQLAKMKIFREENIPEIKNGKLEIEANIKGYTKNQLPLIVAKAYLDSLQVYNRFGKVIDNVEFNILFKSTNTKKLMDAQLEVDTLSVLFSSGGYFRCRAVVNNFNKPAFKIDWDASENLENLDKLIKIPQVKSMSGKLNSQGSISGIYDVNASTLLAYKGTSTIGFNNNNVVLQNYGYSIKDINGLVYWIDGDIGLNGVTLDANSNTMELGGRIKNFLPYVLGKPTQLSAFVTVQSNKLNTETLLAFDKVLADSNTYIIRDVNVALQAELESKSLTNFTIIPTGKINVLNFTALVDGAPPIIKFSGGIEATQKLVALKKFSGIIGKTKVDFSLSVSNYADYLQTNTTEKIVVDVSLKSEKVNVKDFFTINNKFVLPKNYQEEVLKNMVINAKVITTNTELQKTELLPEFELQLTGLQFQTLYSPVVFKDIYVFGLVKDNNVYINSMFGKFGRSDVFMNAQFDNVVATKDTISRPLKSRISFNAGVLDLNELVKLGNSQSDTDTTTQQTTASNPFADKFPITEFQLNIGELDYYDATIKNLSGLLKIEKNNFIHLHDIKLQSGEYGSFEFDGELDASSYQEAILNSTIKVSDVDLSKLNVTYIQDNKEVKISDHFAGIVNGEIIADVPILQDFSFDLTRLTGKLKVKMTDGALINYAPLEEMGNYFKNKDLNRVRFDELKNTMIFKNGSILLPFMTINTTLGTINLMGFQSLDNSMEYDIQVPIKLVAGSVLNSLFASKKGDDTKDDTIKKAGKGKYVTVHISGKDDQYHFKLGKKHVLTAPAGFADN